MKTIRRIPMNFNWRQIARLNHLNNLLMERQRELVRKIKDEIDELELQIIETPEQLSNYEVIATMNFYMKKNHQPVHSNSYYIDIKGLKGFLDKFENLEFDWHFGSLPVLDQPYCYLLSELFEYWEVVNCVSEIVMVWSSVCVDHQHAMVLYKGKWMSISKYGKLK